MKYGSLQVRSLSQAWPMWQNPVPTKIIKISRMWGHTPVILAIWEAKARELLEPERQRLPWAKIAPLHSSLGCRLSQKNKINKIKFKRQREEKVGFILQWEYNCVLSLKTNLEVEKCVFQNPIIFVCVCMCVYVHIHIYICVCVYICTHKTNT